MTLRQTQALTAPNLAPPLSLYVHLPWCLRKCPYCDFNSFETKAGLPERDYVDALLRDLDAERPNTLGRPLESIFIGGGTPSLFSGAAIARLLDGIRERCALARAIEITLEANPGAAEAGRFAEYRAAGVNRLSIGLQSLRDEALAALGRVHSAAEAAAAVGHARAAGFEQINLDLMYALPGDGVDDALRDLEAVTTLGPAHIAWYQLTLEPNTAFHRRPPALPDEDAVLEIEARGRALLEERGYERYEISAYARPGARCVHNLNYWRFGDYIGIGAGAHGKLTIPAGHGIERRAKQRNPRSYMMAAGAQASVERIESAQQIALEYLMNALRLTGGTGFDDYEARTGQPRSLLEPGLAEARRRGWIATDPDRLQATPAGLQMLNRLLELF